MNITFYFSLLITTWVVNWNNFNDTIETNDAVAITYKLLAQ